MNKAYLNYEQPEIKKAYIPEKINTRPGITRDETRGICIHHTGLKNVPAVNFYHAIQREAYKTYASYHIILDYDGVAWVIIPTKEIAYGSGSYRYSKIGKDIFKSEAWNYTIDIEVCVADNYRINKTQLKALAALIADLCIDYHLEPTRDLYRHNDIALDKPECPFYLLDDSKWTSLIIESKDLYNKKQKGKIPHRNTKDIK